MCGNGSVENSLQLLSGNTVIVNSGKTLLTRSEGTDDNSAD